MPCAKWCYENVNSKDSCFYQLPHLNKHTLELRIRLLNKGHFSKGKSCQLKRLYFSHLFEVLRVFFFSFKFNECNEGSDKVNLSARGTGALLFTAAVKFRFCSNPYRIKQIVPTEKRTKPKKFKSTITIFSLSVKYTTFEKKSRWFNILRVDNVLTC